MIIGEEISVNGRLPPLMKNNYRQAGAELCQAQVKLEVLVYIVEEAWI